jgi:hypothetical protein
MHTLKSGAPPLILAAAGLDAPAAIRTTEASVAIIIKPVDLCMASPPEIHPRAGTG